jgi:hypothetical protein
VPLCGLIAHYNDREQPAGPDRLPPVTFAFLIKRVRMQGFIIGDHYGPAFNAFLRQMSTLVSDVKVKFREDIIEGLENAPGAFIGMLEGKNFGKLVVNVAKD